VIRVYDGDHAAPLGRCLEPILTPSTPCGHPGWGAIIPIYNLWIIVKMAGREPMWFWLILILGVIPIVNIASIILLLIVDTDVARNFGHGAGFAVLLWLFPEIMYLILGFGTSEYRPMQAGSQARLA
jgi:hypothetical protein